MACIHMYKYILFLIPWIMLIVGFNFDLTKLVFGNGFSLGTFPSLARVVPTKRLVGANPKAPPVIPVASPRRCCR